MPDPVDGRGCFTSDVPDFEGVHVKAADPGLIEKLRAGGHLVYSGVEVHNYPHCWRSDTPLIYKAIPAWFIKVEERPPCRARLSDFRGTLSMPPGIFGFV